MRLAPPIELARVIASANLNAPGARALATTPARAPATGPAAARR